MTKNTGLGGAMSSRPKTRAERRGELAAIRPTGEEAEATAAVEVPTAPAVAPAVSSESAASPAPSVSLDPTPAVAAVPPQRPLRRLQKKAKPTKVRITTDIESDVHVRLEYVKDSQKLNVTDIASEALDLLFDQMGVPDAAEIIRRKRA